MLDVDVIVAPTNVKLCKVARALQLIDEFRDQGQWGSVFDGDVAQVSIVLNRLEAVALLFDKEKGAGDGRL